MYPVQFADSELHAEFVTPPHGTPDSEVLSGQYALSNRFDMTGDDVLPGTVADAISALSSLRDDPARTMVDLVEAVDAPLVATLMDLIPNSLEDEIFSAMNASVPNAEYLATMVEDVARMMTDVELITTLVVAPPAEFGNTALSHQLSGIAFQFVGKRFVVYAPQFASELSTARDVAANAVHVLENGPGIEDGRLHVGDHSMSVPIGRIAMLGLDVAAQKRFHAPTFRDALGAIVECGGMAAGVVEHCPGQSCTSIEQPIADVCEAGLDQVVASLASRMSDIKLDLVRFTGGEAAMYDVRFEEPVDGKIDRIDRGHWDMSIAIRDDGVHAIVPGTFSGVRIGDYQRPEPPTSGLMTGGYTELARDGDSRDDQDPIQGPIFEIEQVDAPDPLMPGGDDAIDDPSDAQTTPGGDKAIDPSKAGLYSPGQTSVAPEHTNYDQYGLDVIVDDALGAPHLGGEVAFNDRNVERTGSGVGGGDAVQTIVVVVSLDTDSRLTPLADR